MKKKYEFLSKKFENVFCKTLTKNDDSGRHGVLIPVSAYSMFPDFSDFDPTAKVNYTEKIKTFWPNENDDTEIEIISSWKHYHRYPERRMTSLMPELINNHGEKTLFVVAKEKGSFNYHCYVYESSSEDYSTIGQLFKLPETNGLFDGSAFLKVDDLLNEDSKVIDELTSKIKAIKNNGYVKNLKKGDTGVGYTLETLLGIDSNSSKLPDYKGIEIKASRSNKEKEKRKSQSGKQTLFTLIPNWGEVENRKNLVSLYGYDDLKRERRGLYCTIKVVENSYGFTLYVNRKEEKISVMKHNKEVVFYEFERLKESLETKHKESVFITAHAIKNEEKEEFFLYDSLIHCKNVSFESFLDIIEENLLGLDFAIHTKNGKTRDHGFLWRLDNKKYIYRLFQTVMERI